MPKSPAVNKKTVVFDTFVIMTLLFKEPGYEMVNTYLKNARSGKLHIFFNEISFGEAYYRTWENNGPEAARIALDHMSRLPLTLIPVDRAFILAAASWKGRYTISYADAFVVETAIRNKCPIITNDQEFDSVQEVQIVKLSRK